MKILVIDDVSANLIMMQRLLKKNGHDVMVHSSPIDALEVLSGKNSVDLIITDYMMPEVKGNEFIQLLHSLPCYKSFERPVPPCILVTAWSEEFTVGDALNLGFCAVLKKPFPNQALLDLISSLSAGDFNPQKGYNLADSASTQTILVVDDLGVDVMFLEKLFRKWHYEILTTNSMEQAFNILTSPRNAKISAVISDILTDKINGYELFKKYKQNFEATNPDKAPNLPFIMLVESECDQLTQYAVLEGVQYILKKPLSILELQGTLKELPCSKQ